MGTESYVVRQPSIYVTESFGEFKNRVDELLGVPGHRIANSYSTSGAKIGNFFEMAGELNLYKGKGALDVKKKINLLAWAMLTQMGSGSWFGGAHFKSFEGVEPKIHTMNRARYLEDANLFIAEHITASDLRDALYANIINTDAPRQLKLDYIAALYKDMNSIEKKEFVRGKPDARREILLKAAANQLAEMKKDRNISKDTYAKYVAQFTKITGRGEGDFAALAEK